MKDLEVPIVEASASGRSSVSVVIPTCNRARMVAAAVRSALAQTHAPLEVLVVLDGPESRGAQNTADALAEIDDARLRLISLDAHVGGAEARNIGVREARGHWIAFLDDDDLWLPSKLRNQLDFASRLAAGQIPVLSCPVLARGPAWGEVWPREAYRPNQPMAEYLFCRKGLSYGSALLQTSTLVAPRSLLLSIPFAAGLRKHQDWDWLLRVSAAPGVSVHSVGSVPLALFHVEGNRTSVGRTPDWRFSMEWALEREQYFSKRALSGFLVTECASQAQRAHWRERAELTRVVFTRSRPNALDLLRLTTFLLLPQPARRAVRNRLRPRREGQVEQPVLG